MATRRKHQVDQGEKTKRSEKRRKKNELQCGEMGANQSYNKTYINITKTIIKILI